MLFLVPKIEIMKPGPGQIFQLTTVYKFFFRRWAIWINQLYISSCFVVTDSQCDEPDHQCFLIEILAES